MGDEVDVRATKRRLLERSAKLLARVELAQRLNVTSALLDAWMRGEATMPDGKLMHLARILDAIGRMDRRTGQGQAKS